MKKNMVSERGGRKRENGFGCGGSEQMMRPNYFSYSSRGKPYSQKRKDKRRNCRKIDPY